MASELSAHDQYVAILNDAVETVNRALARLEAAAATHAEMVAELRQFTDGSAISDLPRIYAEVESQIRAQIEHLRKKVASVEEYIADIGGSESGSSSRPRETAPAAQQGGAGSPDRPTHEAVERLKRQLPDPIQPDDRGRKTHGRWIGPDGKVHETVSGRDDDATLAMEQLQEKGIPRKPLRTTDVEMKLAARMADTGITEATVVINNVPCEGVLSCDTLVPILLPDGSALTVHGVEPDGTPFVKRYEGGARPWWH